MSDVTLQTRLQMLSSEYQEQPDVVETRQHLEARLSENERVRTVCTVACLPHQCSRTDDTEQEFQQLTPENVVYKRM